MNEGIAISVRYYRLSAAIEPCFTALYSFSITCADDAVIEDFLHPEWAAMRFTEHGLPPVAGIMPAPIADCPDFVISGPTRRAIRFRLRQSRLWGLGLMPLGWARFVDEPAQGLADRIVDGMDQPGFAAFRPLLDLVRQTPDDPDQTAARINDFLLSINPGPIRAESQILACQMALRDPEIGDVAQLAAAVGVGGRSLERLCSRHFGFPPKQLLNRQRFLRSLARYTLGEEEYWTNALDGQYHDQAHFVRDFRKFMGMTPSEYADTPHPILDRIMAQRMADQGAAPPTDLPTILRYRQPAENGAADPAD